ncbi:phage tail length tape-measure protein [Pseudonocardia sp. N23]|nr:phage tail length tape-measure protein [Pseudonocardia sp. N23]
MRPDLRLFGSQLQAGLRGTTSIADRAGKLIGAAIGGGAIAAGLGLAGVVKVGNEFDSTLSRIQATSGASATAMQQVAARARELGSDATLAGTSSQDAASAIEELAKAGLSVSDSMVVARDAIALSRAGMMDGGEAASLLANTLNTYGLSAADATRVTDVFAATANASTTDIRDLGASLEYVAPTAAGLKISLEDTSTALAMLSTAGIKGSSAGTALRGVLASLAAPSKPAAAAMQELGIQAFDASGKFVGLEAITRQLTEAKGRLTDAEFTAATATAFGAEGMSAANVLASQGTEKFRELGTAVREQGAAQKAAAANSQGLSGAMDQLEGNAQDLALSIYDLIKGPLAQLATAGAGGLGGLADLLSGKGVSAGPLQAALDKATQTLTNLKVAAAPVASGIRAVFDSFKGGAGEVGLVTSVLTGLAGAVEFVSRVLGPIGSLIGGVLKTFSALPGPVQTAVLAFLAFRAVSGFLNTTAGATSRLGQAVNALRPTQLLNFTEAMRTQRAMATSLGQPISRLASVTAAYQTAQGRAVEAARGFTNQMGAIRAGAAGAGAPISTLTAGMRTLAERSPGIAAIGSSFNTARTAITNFGTGVASTSTHFSGAIGAATRFTGVLGGLGAAAATATRVGFSGLLGALGGPWGAVLIAAGAALTIFGQKNAEAAQKAQQHQAAIDNLKGSLNQVTGAATDATRAIQAQELTNTKLKDGTTSLSSAIAKLGIDSKVWVDATTGNQAALESVNLTLHNQARGVLETSNLWNGSLLQSYKDAGGSLDLLADAAIGNEQAFAKFAEMQGASGAGADYLRQELAKLVGPIGEVGSLLGDSAGKFADASKAARDAATASATFDNALKLLGDNKAFETLKDGATATAPVLKMLSDVTAAAGKSAQQAGQDALKFTGSVESGAVAARDAMAKSREAFVAQAEAALGSREAAEALANQIGLIPAAAETIFRTNATGVTAELITLDAQIGKLPAGKSVTIRSITEEAQQKLETFGFKVEHLKDGTVKITAPTEEAGRQLDAFIASISGKEGKISLVGDPTKVNGTIVESVAFADGSTGNIKLDGEPSLVNEKVQSAVVFADGSKGTITIDGNRNPADGSINGTVTYANGQTGTIKIAGDNSAAMRAISAAILAASRTVLMNISATVTTAVVGPKAQGDIVSAQANGSVLGFAAGGMKFNGHTLRKMSPYAQIVPPRTYRVVGDRVKDDEAYIPINKSPRSLAIFEETARRMGYSVTRNFADGGFAQSLRSSIARNVRFNGSSVAEFSPQQLSQLISAVSSGREVLIQQTVNNPIAERASATLTRELRTLSQLGAFSR